MSKTKTKLKNLLIDRVDLVGKGDNPEAHISLFKSADNSTGGEALEDVIKRYEEKARIALSKTKGVETMFDIKKFMEELPEDQRDGLKKHLDTLESAKIKTLTKQLEEKDTSVTELQKATEEKDASITELTDKVAKLQKADGGGEGDSTNVIKELPEDIRKMVEDSVAKAKESEEEVKKLRDESLTKEYVEKASGFEALPVDAQDIGPVFKRVAEISKEDYEKLEALLKAADEQLIQNNILLKEVGKGGSATTEQPAWEKVEAEAAKLATADPSITKEQAISKVLEVNPQLYQEYEKELMEVQ